MCVWTPAPLAVRPRSSRHAERPKQRGQDRSGTYVQAQDEDAGLFVPKQGRQQPAKGVAHGRSDEGRAPRSPRPGGGGRGKQPARRASSRRGRRQAVGRGQTQLQRRGSGAAAVLNTPTIQAQGAANAHLSPASRPPPRKPPQWRRWGRGRAGRLGGRPTPARPAATAHTTRLARGTHVAPRQTDLLLLWQPLRRCIVNKYTPNHPFEGMRRNKVFGRLSRRLPECKGGESAAFPAPRARSRAFLPFRSDEVAIRCYAF